jgi:hypothetical protein
MESELHGVVYRKAQWAQDAKSRFGECSLSFIPLVLAVLKNFTRAEGFAAVWTPEEFYPTYFELVTKWR